MSTKIYTGFAWDCPDFGQVMSALRELEGRIRQASNARKAKLLAQLATGFIDRACILASRAEPCDALTTEKAKSDLETPLIDAWQKMWDRQDKMRQSSRRDPAVDFEVRIAMWYVPESRTLIGHLLSEDQGAAYEMLLACSGVSDFSYWNNTDPPEELSQEAWDARRVLWDRVSDNAFGLPLVITVDADERIERDAIEEGLPTHEKRVAKIALDSAFSQWQKERAAALQSDGTEQDVDVEQWVSTWMDFIDETGNPESAASGLVESEKVRVAAWLPVNIRPLLDRYSEQKAGELLTGSASLEPGTT